LRLEYVPEDYLRNKVFKFIKMRHNQSCRLETLAENVSSLPSSVVAETKKSAFGPNLVTGRWIDGDARGWTGQDEYTA